MTQSTFGLLSQQFTARFSVDEFTNPNCTFGGCAFAEHNEHNGKVKFTLDLGRVYDIHQVIIERGFYVGG